MTKITKQEQDSKLLRGQTGSLDSFHIYKPNQELTITDELLKAQAIVYDWEMREACVIGDESCESCQ